MYRQYYILLTITQKEITLNNNGSLAQLAERLPSKEKVARSILAGAMLIFFCFLYSNFLPSDPFVGASDAAVPICVMLETLRVFVHSYGGDAVHLKHPIIFLFNGAEESLQQASHAFITYHPWGQK